MATKTNNMNWQTLLKVDSRLSNRIRLNTLTSRWRLPASVLAHSGDSWFWLAGLGLSWLLTSGEWHWRTAIMIFGLVFLAVVVLGIKFSVRRRRPEGEWGAIYRATDPHSFPSGHASRAALLAVIALGTGPAWLGLLLLIWAPLVSLARVVMGVHYLSDVLVGLIIGTVMGLAMLSTYPLLIQLFPFLF